MHLPRLLKCNQPGRFQPSCLRRLPVCLILAMAATFGLRQSGQTDLIVLLWRRGRRGYTHAAPMPDEKRPDEEPRNCDRLPPWLRRLLYRAVDHITDSRHARRQASRHALRATGAGLELRHFRPAGAAALLFRLASERGDVRRLARAGAGLADPARARHAPGPGVSTKARSLKRRTQADPTKRWRRPGVREPLSW